jgi:propionyl-CoA carboxylase alpha chain
MKYVARIEGQVFSLDLQESNGDVEAVVDGKSTPVRLERVDNGSTLCALIGGRSVEVDITRDGSCYLIHYRGNTYRCAVDDKNAAELKQLMNHTSERVDQKELRSPMPGLVLDVAVSPGQRVETGDALLILEAMKMENEIRSPFTAVIKAVKVKVGQAVELNQLLIVFE